MDRHRELWSLLAARSVASFAQFAAALDLVEARLLPPPPPPPPRPPPRGGGGTANGVHRQLRAPPRRAEQEDGLADLPLAEQHDDDRDGDDDDPAAAAAPPAPPPRLLFSLRQIKRGELPPPCAPGSQESKQTALQQRGADHSH
jgi:hypothetical protein